MRRLPAGRFLLGYLLLVTAVITLAPFRFTRPVAPHLSWLVDPGDVVANVLLFVPLGFLYRVAERPSAHKGHWPTVGAALLVSAALETLQLFLPGRFASPLDVATGVGDALERTHKLVIVRVAANPNPRYRSRV